MPPSRRRSSPRLYPVSPSPPSPSSISGDDPGPAFRAYSPRHNPRRYSSDDDDERGYATNAHRLVTDLARATRAYEARNARLRQKYGAAIPARKLETAYNRWRDRRLFLERKYAPYAPVNSNSDAEDVVYEERSTGDEDDARSESPEYTAWLFPEGMEMETEEEREVARREEMWATARRVDELGVKLRAARREARGWRRRYRWAVGVVGVLLLREWAVRGGR